MLSLGAVIPQKRKDGSIGFMAQTAIRRDGHVQRETKTFDHKQAAFSGLEIREHELEKLGAIEQAKGADPILAETKGVHIDDLANWIDERRAAAMKELKKMTE
ncbi:pyocin activator PrtN family protein [Methylocystis sp. MJC1]|uniref:hypothetical protein n=1 Tax=Methylocystis sp. MJC1 TaxID=2654282 RepID=UPI0013ED1486|nr:hypothetical protein [Methylocystis sp. MJC1]KAF2992708.1 hypothetical protein MJC1_00287 [Methylocystis sp. MJC1]MBU6526673.1 hypothetical protein [Methylocystis sp. MJC1]UZX13112.1 pyocin activator PrtN family protein [Methylocystis sp. MJC1]